MFQAEGTDRANVFLMSMPDLPEGRLQDLFGWRKVRRGMVVNEVRQVVVSNIFFIVVLFCFLF